MRYPGGERPAVHSYKRATLQPNDYKVIAVLKKCGADKEYVPIRQKAIAVLTGMTQSKISMTVDRLCFKKIVSRFRYSNKEDALMLLVYSSFWEYAINRHILLKPE